VKQEVTKVTVAHRDGFVTQKRHPFGKELFVNRQVALRADPLIKYAASINHWRR
jgi:hypothetical protein